MTLIEVVAGLALLGTLLGAAVVAQQRLRHQWASAHDRVEAIEALDRQLQTFTLAPAPAPGGPGSSAPPGSPGSPGSSQTNFPGSGNFSVNSNGDENRAMSSAWPIDKEGDLAGTPWRWRSSRLERSAPAAETDRPTIGIVRFEAFDPADPLGKVLATLDVLTYESSEVSPDDPSANPGPLDRYSLLGPPSTSGEPQ